MMRVQGRTRRCGPQEQSGLDALCVRHAAKGPEAMTDQSGYPGLPFSSQDLPGIVAKGRKLGLSDEVLAIQLQLTQEELTRIEAGDAEQVDIVVAAWQQRVWAPRRLRRGPAPSHVES